MPDRNSPLWLEQARRYMGSKYVPDLPVLPLMAGLRASFRAKLKRQPEPWCAAALCAWLGAAGQQGPQRWWQIDEWKNWGQACDHLLGAVVVARTPYEDVLGLLLGVRSDGCPVVLWGATGGNVSPIALDPSHVVAVRWPAGLATGAPAPMF
jgi:hypothetical protein